ncbi:hypothetical protein ACKF11_13510 [Methylobacillus sp. Pita2]|uniref:hypothetical protein n=1 Tax=Methylobacillus sp. Pita2 TaxID=3383245 RepID=UPI0038B6A537
MLTNKSLNEFMVFSHQEPSVPATTNTQFVFEHYFPKVNADRDGNGQYIDKDTAQLFQGFSRAWEAREDELIANRQTVLTMEAGHKIVINVKQKLIEKLQGDLESLQRKVDRLESEAAEQSPKPRMRP